jgi:hypothetical protein
VAPKRLVTLVTTIIYGPSVAAAMKKRGGSAVLARQA